VIEIDLPDNSRRFAGVSSLPPEEAMILAAMASSAAS
jgi:hypothetical protein